MQQSDAPLADVLGLLSTLAEAWAEIRTPADKPVVASPRPQPVPQEAEKPVVENPWSQPLPLETGYAPQGYAAHAYASQEWSL
jgi:hypothetical protein